MAAAWRQKASWGKEVEGEGSSDMWVEAGGEGAERRYRTGSASERESGKQLRWNSEVEVRQTARTGVARGRSRGLPEGSPVRVG